MNRQREKILIVNADDFGLSEGINSGVVRSFKEGIVTSASVMPAASAFEDALRRAKENPELDIGVHLCLSEEMPLEKPEDVPSLVGPDGRFFRSHTEFVRRYFFGRINMREVERELSRQIARVVSSGINISHLDSHGHLHMLPRIFELVLRLAEDYHIAFVRFPLERKAKAKVSFRRRLIGLALGISCASVGGRFKSTAIRRTDNVIGLALSGRLCEFALSDMLSSLEGGTTELVCHPGEADVGLERYRHWGYAWEDELRCLCAPHIPNALHALGIALGTFSDLP